MFENTNLYLLKSNRNLCIIKTKSFISVDKIKYSQEEIKIKESKEVLTWAYDLTLEKIYRTLWQPGDYHEDNKRLLLNNAIGSVED